MDLSKEWAEFTGRRFVESVTDEQDELQAQATRLIHAAAAALKQYHDHRRVHGQHAIVPMQPLQELILWMEIMIESTEC